MSIACVASAIARQRSAMYLRSMSNGDAEQKHDILHTYGV